MRTLPLRRSLTRIKKARWPGRAMLAYHSVIVAASGENMLSKICRPARLFEEGRTARREA
jgi:hypothetical protein